MTSVDQTDAPNCAKQSPAQTDKKSKHRCKEVETPQGMLITSVGSIG
jgi:hypothetical protein